MWMAGGSGERASWQVGHSVCCLLPACMHTACPALAGRRGAYSARHHVALGTCSPQRQAQFCGTPEMHAGEIAAAA